MQTEDVVSSFIYKDPSMRFAFEALDIVCPERPWTGKEHPELNNQLRWFIKPKIITSIGILESTFIIQPNKVPNKRGLWAVITIEGNYTRFDYLSKDVLYRTILRKLNIHDFVPASFSRKIVYINEYKPGENNIGGVVSGVVFSEYNVNRWTLDDPLKFDAKSIKSSPTVILLKILDELKEESDHAGNIYS
jgi:hypothetical protein